MAESPWKRHWRLVEEIASRRKELKKQEEALWEELKAAQTKCKHKHVTGGMFSNTCNDCGLDDF
jgi:pyruvate/oxaloacetate carboxyltransferase